MLRSNYIADPHALSDAAYLGPIWLDNYATFKSRLNWLLLWNDEVHVFDSFFLFNRQFEHWFMKAREEPKSDGALRELFASGAVKPRVRE
jgi:hypothetical protein